MRSKKDQTGELVIDHRNSPGISLEWAAAVGISGPIVGAGKTFESGLKNCTHCGGDVIMNPMRQREREWCRVCDAYICDNCGLLRKLGGYEHKTARQQIEEIYTSYQNLRSF
jgi:hypothetical protein